MNIEFERKSINGHFVNVYETSRVTLGFTELDFPPEDLTRMFPRFTPVLLTQVHSDIILFSSEIAPGVETEGDGIILDREGKIAVIETADCTPLFFWHPGFDTPFGGVVHVGWKGLVLGIEKILLKRLEEKYPSMDIRRLEIFLGPSIEAKCYEVKDDLYNQFASKSFRDDIFSTYDPGDGSERMVLDVKKGVRLSLMECGIPADHIAESPLCTYCEPGRFPSYRRAKGTGQRIHNFLLRRGLVSPERKL